MTQSALFAADDFSVPAGKRLIVETVMLDAEVPPGDQAACGLTATPAGGGIPRSHKFVMTPQGVVNSALDVFISNSPVRLYFSPGEELTWFCYRSNGSGFITFTWSISGYLVDV